MSGLLSSVSEHLLAPGGVTIESLQGVLGDLAGPGIDAADLYFQGQISESWALEDGIVKEGSFNLDQGVGVRAYRLPLFPGRGPLASFRWSRHQAPGGVH